MLTFTESQWSSSDHVTPNCLSNAHGISALLDLPQQTASYIIYSSQHLSASGLLLLTIITERVSADVNSHYNASPVSRSRSMLVCLAHTNLMHHAHTCMQLGKVLESLTKRMIGQAEISRALHKVRLPD